MFLLGGASHFLQGSLHGTSFWGETKLMQMYGSFEGFPLDSALFGLIIHIMTSVSLKFNNHPCPRWSCLTVLDVENIWEMIQEEHMFQVGGAKNHQLKMEIRMNFEVVIPRKIQVNYPGFCSDCCYSPFSKKHV